TNTKAIIVVQIVCDSHPCATWIRNAPELLRRPGLSPAGDHNRMIVQPSDPIVAPLREVMGYGLLHSRSSINEHDLSTGRFTGQRVEPKERNGATVPRPRGTQRRPIVEVEKLGWSLTGCYDTLMGRVGVGEDQRHSASSLRSKKR